MCHHFIIYLFDIVEFYLDIFVTDMFGINLNYKSEISLFVWIYVWSNFYSIHDLVPASI